MFRRYSQLVPILVLCSLPLLVGCGGSGIEVSGTVFLDGKPLPGAEVEFKQAGTEDVFATVADNDGKFEMRAPGGKGIPAGSYEVDVLFWVDKKGQLAPDSEEAEDLKLRGVYVQVAGSSKAEVSKDKNTVNLEIDRASLSRVDNDIGEGGEDGGQ